MIIYIVVYKTMYNLHVGKIALRKYSRIVENYSQLISDKNYFSDFNKGNRPCAVLR